MFPGIVGAAGGLLGGILGDVQRGDANAANLKYQEEFAQNGIQWKVADARAAGISPLAALGASTPGFSPSFQAGDGISNFLSSEGQDISRAAMASQSSQEQADANADNAAYVKKMHDLDIIKGELGVELMKSQLAQATQQPGIPNAFNPVRMPDGTVIQVPSREMGVTAFTPYLNQGLGAYGAAMGVGGYLQRGGKALQGQRFDLLNPMSW